MGNARYVRETFAILHGSHKQLEGPNMSLAINLHSRFFLIAVFLLSCLFGANALRAQQTGDLPPHVVQKFGKPPAIPQGDISEDLKDAVRTAFIDTVTDAGWGRDQSKALRLIASSEDPRLVWIIADLMRFSADQGLDAELLRAASTLLNKDLSNVNSWGVVTDHLIAWDIPAPPDYLAVKREIFTNIVPGWEPLFVEGDIDWRLVSWGDLCARSAG